ncbi:631_t:CDS:1, partial [Scutellospora calospora]
IIEIYNHKKATLEFKNNISQLLEFDDFENNENFITNHIRDDRDKDIMTYKISYDFLVCCKQRRFKKIGFNEIERISNVANIYNSQGVIVTPVGYSPKAMNAAILHNVILTYPHNIVEKLNLYIERNLENQELDILYEILYQ